ncbi:MAG: glycosidase, partial [Candidatus Margulisiibacteriota bacterium]
MLKNNSLVNQTKILLSPNSACVVLRKFDPNPNSRISSIIGRINALSEKEVARNLKMIVSHFFKRHLHIEETLRAHYEMVKPYFDTDYTISENRKLLIGAYFTTEYAFESAALFNPSIVIHPDQSGVPTGTIRFIMGLRAIGEGHISSLTFRTGTIDQDCNISMDPVSPYKAVAPLLPNTSYDKLTFHYKLIEMECDNAFTAAVLKLLPDSFTLNQLQETLNNFVNQNHCYSENDKLVHDKMLRLALSNYGVSISNQHPLSYWVIFPASPS